VTETAPRESEVASREGRASSTLARPRSRWGTTWISLLRASRPKQWIKNLLVFAAPAAAGVLGHQRVLVRASVTFVAFCMVSSAMYLLNDVADREDDARHPTKLRRPIASGALEVRTAVFAATILLAGGLGAVAPIGWAVLGVIAAYAVLTVSYSLWLKPIAVTDIGAVALGFVLRAVAGSVATDVPDSRWFLILISFGSLFVVAGKRYADLVQDEPAGARRRPIPYTGPYLRFVWTVSAALAVAAYCLWAFGSPQAVRTPGWAQISAIPFVLAILRYALVLEAGKAGAPEDIALTDRPLQILIVVWLVTYAIGVYVVG
jgi:decaprenyl-phosphate phosphoribosyltransferase